MWNVVILPILTSLAATGLGILAVWLYNRKRSDGKIANDITRMTNEISAVKAQMENGFDRERLERGTLREEFRAVKIQMEQANEAAALKQREFYQTILERIHRESVAREEFNQTFKISIDTIQETLAKHSEAIDTIQETLAKHSDAIAGLEQKVSHNSDLIGRIIDIIERDVPPPPRA